MSKIPVEIKQINIKEFDERYYQRGDDFAPSVTYILQCVYPTGFGLIDWIGNVGNKRADEIKNESAEEGSFVHESIEKILKGFRISNEEINTVFKNHKRALKVKRCLQSFINWYNEFKPEIISTEKTIWNEEHCFAGTLDLKCRINDEIWTVDFKTSKDVHDSHKVQVSAYRFADGDEGKCAILHLGNSTKKRYSWIEVDYDKYFHQFTQFNTTFKILYPNAKPNEETFPEYFEIIK